MPDRIEPFRIDVADSVLSDLSQRLSRVIWPGEIDNDHWQRGTNGTYLRELVEYWRDGYDWRAIETKLNALPHFRIQIEGQGIHFVHLRAANSRLPLIATHGWPSTFNELVKLSELLAGTGAGAGTATFDVVIPSLPGFGFSDKPTVPFVHRHVPGLWAQLMTRLGYDRFGAHGGDLGGGITAVLGAEHPERLAGIHVTNVYGAIGVGDPPPTPAERAYLNELDRWAADEGGYEAIQRTRPQTVAFGLADSPVGLAAWVVEKLRAWSDCDGDVETVFSKDEILTVVMLYWVTQTISSSFSPYYDSRADPSPRPWQPITVPCAVAVFPRDLDRPPREFAERSYNVVQWTEMPRGGHFAAFEQPQLLAGDITRFFSTLI